MELALAATAGATAGLASIAHCAAMCGPLAGYACRRSDEGAGGAALAARYQVGRAVSYIVAGAVVGAVGEEALGALPSHVSLALSGLLAVAMAAYAVALWRRGPGALPGGALSSDRPVALRASRRKKLRSPGVRQRAVRALARGPMTLGFASVLLPCGALWAALLIAAGTTTASGGAVVMASFAVVSGVGVAGSGWLLDYARRLGSRGARACAIALLLGAGLLAYRPAVALAALAAPDAAPTSVPCPIHPGMTVEVAP